MKQNIKIWFWVLAWILLTLMIFYFIWKHEENKKLEMLWITKEQAEEIKSTFNNEVPKVEKVNNSEITESDKDFLKTYGVNIDEDWYYYVDDYYYLLWHPTKDFTKIFFKKEWWKWYWSISNKTNWGLINSEVYSNPNGTLYNWYRMRWDVNKSILKELLSFNS
jgi:hypothetical protein